MVFEDLVLRLLLDIRVFVDLWFLTLEFFLTFLVLVLLLDTVRGDLVTFLEFELDGLGETLLFLTLFLTFAFVFLVPRSFDLTFRSDLDIALLSLLDRVFASKLLSLPRLVVDVNALLSERPLLLVTALSFLPLRPSAASCLYLSLAFPRRTVATFAPLRLLMNTGCLKLSLYGLYQVCLTGV